MPRHELDALAPDDRWAVIALETHIWFRGEEMTEYEPFEQGDDGKPDCVFLTAAHMQRLLRRCKAPKRGEKYAGECIQILLRLGLLESTGRIKRPLAKKNRGGTTEGGRHAQTSTHHSFWWKIYRVPAISRVLAPIAGAYRLNRQGEASLSAFLVRQGLIGRKRTPSSFAKGSVQAAFWATGPP